MKSPTFKTKQAETNFYNFMNQFMGLPKSSSRVVHTFNDGRVLYEGGAKWNK